ncbi:hypothetical protein [Pelagibaculum spongiae]|nr:hypothetical protein [Pelagibaculum spongiae]
MKQLVLFLTIFLLSATSNADQYTSHVKLDCAPSLGYFKFEYNRVYSNFYSSREERKVDDKLNNFLPFKNVSCNLPMGLLEFKITKERQGNSDYYLDVHFKGKKVLSDIYMEVAGFYSDENKYILKEIQGDYFDKRDTDYLPSFVFIFKKNYSNIFIPVSINPFEESLSKEQLINRIESKFQNIKKELLEEAKKPPPAGCVLRPSEIG